MSNHTPPDQLQVLKKIRLEWQSLDFTNKVLLMIGFVLLLELIFSIFLHTLGADTSTDTFFRISFSSVMGYFLGGMNTTSKEEAHDATEIECSPETRFQHVNHIRTLFITIVCLACIITLSIATFTNRTDYSEGLIQLRNIISTTIGFLISKATYRE